MSIELYHSWDSFCSFKVRFCLEEKGIDWKSHNIQLMRFENLSREYLKVNPKGLVPTLIHNSRQFTESSVINEYLDDAFPAVPLRPADPYALSQMRLWVKVEEEELFKAIRPASVNLMMKQVFDGYSDQQLDDFLSTHPKPHMVPTLIKTFREPVNMKAVEKSRKMLKIAFTNMETVLSNQPWLAGGNFSLADIAAAPVIDRIQCLNMTDIWENMCGIKNWIERIMQRPAYQASKPLDEFRMPSPL